MAEINIPVVGKPCTGYLWKSNENKGEVYLDKNLEYDFSKEPQIPFVVEGYLIQEGTSYSIRFVDGKYKIQSYALNGLSGESVTYYAHRLEKIEKLKFIRLWKPEQDSLCENFDVLVPKAEVFVGIVKKKGE